jgi:hypothetical protein
VSALIIPAATEQKEPVLKRFIKDIRLERSKHSKGSLYNSFFKLVGNALYGRFALGVTPKQYFNARTGAHDPYYRAGRSLEGLTVVGLAMAPKSVSNRRPVALEGSSWM